MSISGAYHHFRTITRHRHKVVAHCFRAGIPWRGLMHDLSKYSPTEFREGARCWLGDRSPTEKARAEQGYSAAWLHHKGRNRHHFEFWKDYSPVDRVEIPVRMPVIFVLEMFCDRVAASKTYQGEKYTEHHPIDYFRRGCVTRIIHPQTAALLESWLVMLSEKGEDETFRYLRALRRELRKKGDDAIYERTNAD